MHHPAVAAAPFGAKDEDSFSLSLPHPPHLHRHLRQFGRRKQRRTSDAEPRFTAGAQPRNWPRNRAHHAALLLPMVIESGNLLLSPVNGENSHWVPERHFHAPCSNPTEPCADLTTRSGPQNHCQTLSIHPPPREIAAAAADSRQNPPQRRRPDAAFPCPLLQSRQALRQCHRFTTISGPVQARFTTHSSQPSRR